MGDKVLCAGCLGLASGSIVSIILTIAYIAIMPNETIQGVFQGFIVMGIALIALNFIEIAVPQRNAHMHVVFNGLLVAGFFLVVIGTYELTGRIAYGILAIILSFLWLDTRIHLSNWRHSVICRDCSEMCKVY